MKKDKNNNSFLSISFSKGFCAPNIPIATFYQGDKDLNFIIDTGSDDNVISREALANIDHTMIKHQGTLSGVGGVSEVGACQITFQYEDETFSEKFIISDTLKDAFDMIKSAHAIPLHGMVGSKFLMKNNMVLDFNNMLVYNKKQ